MIPANNAENAEDPAICLKRPMLGACIGGAVGGLVGGFFQMKCFGIATPAIVTIVQYVEKGKPQTLLFAAPCAILEHNSPIQIKFSYPVVAIIPNLIGVNA